MALTKRIIKKSTEKKSDKNEKLFCYVCKKEIKEDQKSFNGTGKDGKPVGRHDRCSTGSSNWLKSDIAKSSKFYDLYKDK
tara:strand:- start:767 stop:1006 length:240 start_codon:yes stop_codon:yes gene_type:complete